MAGDGDRERVGGAGLRHRARRLRRADRAGDFGVGRGRARRDGAQRLPDPLLERGAADVERQVEALARRLDQADDSRHHALERGVAADRARRAESGPASSRASASGSSPSMIAQTPLSVAATSIAPSEPWPTAKRIAAPCAAAPDRARRHAEPRRRGLVEAARELKPGVVDRFGDRRRLAQPIGRAARPRLRGIGLRRHAGRPS